MLRRRSGLMRLAVISAITITTTTLGGCAYSEYLPDGSRRVIGFAAVDILDPEKVPGAGITFNGPVVGVRGIGLSLSKNNKGTGFTLGYLNETSARLQDHNPDRKTSVDIGKGCKEIAFGPLHFATKCNDKSTGPVQTYSGFVDMTVPQPSEDASAGTTIKLQSFGIGTSYSALGDTFDVGFREATVTTIRDDVVILGNPMQIANADNTIKPAAR